MQLRPNLQPNFCPKPKFVFLGVKPIHLGALYVFLIDIHNLEWEDYLFHHLNTPIPFLSLD